jgi:hypothetical protein
MAALQIKNIPTGAGDDIKFDVSYAKGDTKNVIAVSGTSPSFAMFGGSGSAYQSVGLGATTDGVYFPGAGGTGGIKLTTAWGIRGAFNHNWDPYWQTSLFGSYSGVRYDGGANDNILGLGTSTAKGAYCAAFAASHPGQAVVGNAAGAYTCNPDFNVSQLGVLTRWTPVKNLTFSAEAQWFHLDQKMSGSSVFAATAPKPTALYEFKDQNTFCWSFALSVTSDRHLCATARRRRGLDILSKNADSGIVRRVFPGIHGTDVQKAFKAGPPNCGPEACFESFRARV